MIDFCMKKKTLVLLNLIFIGFILFTFEFDLIRSYVKDGYVHFENTYFYMTTIVVSCQHEIVGYFYIFAKN